MKIRGLKTSAGILLALALMLATLDAGVAAESHTRQVPLVQASDPLRHAGQEHHKIREKLRRNGSTRVIVRLAEETGTSHTRSSRQARRAARAAKRGALMQRLRPGIRDRSRAFEHLPYIAMEVDSLAFDTLSQAEEVVAVTEDRLYRTALTETTAVIGADITLSGGHTGAGTLVAVLDTGVDLAHEYFAGKNVIEACFSSNFAPDNATSLCPNGARTQYGAGAARPCTLSGCNPGTHVAGIAVGDGRDAGETSGVSPDAGLVAIQVFSRIGSSDTGAYTSDVVAGLNYVLALRETQGQNIAAVNLSLGGDLLTTAIACDFPDGQASIEKQVIDRLRVAGVATVVASGNGGRTNAMASPGCISSAISVAAGTESDAFASYSNRSSWLSLLAPGRAVRSATRAPDSYQAFSGTSMATPHVAGAIAVLKSAADMAGGSQGLSDAQQMDRLLAILIETAVPVLDTASGFWVPRLQLDQALERVLLGAPAYDRILDSDYEGSVSAGQFDVETLSDAYRGRYHAASGTAGSQRYRFDLSVPYTGSYQLSGWWPSGVTGRGAYQIKTTNGVQTGQFNQGLAGNDWQALGVYHLTADADLFIELSDAAGERIAVDALRLSLLPGNEAPGVSFAQPANNASFTQGESVQLRAVASDADGEVASVAFYANGVLLGSDSSAPYRQQWQATGLGEQRLSAIATDNLGATSNAAVVRVNVTQSVSSDGPVEVTLQRGRNGYDLAADTYLSAIFKTRAHGDSDLIKERKDRWVPLLKFAIFQSEGGPVPDGAQIDAATLSLYKSTPYNYRYALHRLKRGWDEATATWQQRGPGQAWHTAGAGGAGNDWNSTADAEAEIGWSPGWLSFDVADAVNAMADSGNNFGWRMRAIDGNSNAKRFHSREYPADTALRPKLHIRYSLAGGQPVTPLPNSAPSVQLQAPGANAEFNLGDSIQLRASASDSDGNVTQLVFKANGATVATLNATPYNHVWTPSAAGDYNLLAIATDDEAAITESAVVRVKVVADSGDVGNGTRHNLTLQQGLAGYSGARDTYLSSVFKTRVSGGAALIKERVGRWLPLLRFAVFSSEGGPVPNNARIVSARLSLYKSSAYNYRYGAHRILASWEEATATWNQRRAGVPWAQAGAAAEGQDVAAQADAEAEVAWAPGWLSFDVTSALQAIADTGVNHGWRIQPISGNNNGKHFHSREYQTDPGLRPRLQVEYELP